MAESVAQRLSSAGTANALELRGVSRTFGALAALTDITMTVKPGERRARIGLEWCRQDDTVQLHNRRLFANHGHHSPVRRRCHHLPRS